MAKVFGVSGTNVRRLDGGWAFARTDPERRLELAEIQRQSLGWRPAVVPGSVIAAGADEPDLDRAEFWYRTRFLAPEAAYTLRFGGLAPLADVWLDGKHVLSSDNMFVAHSVPVTSGLGRSVELAIRFGALANARHAVPRARWHARSIESDAMRWARTPLFCRMPGLGPRAIPVGPWRPIEVVEHGALRVCSARLTARCDECWGRVFLRLIVDSHETPIRSASLRVGRVSTTLEVSSGDDGSTRIHGVASFANVERWWPHTHGPQVLYPVSVEVVMDDRSVVIDLGKIGFRELELSSENGEFGFNLNGVPIFCRGACWLPLDPVSLDASPLAIERTLGLARDAGMNMLRAVAQGIYESDSFFQTAAELGILIWQDFLFSRLDYADDAEFTANVEHEARDLLDRTEQCPALALFCGNSEIEQQVAMLGLDPALGRHELFTRVLPGAVRELRPDVPFLESTPSGGALPFHVDQGPSHYFGVGAYLRPLSDVRLSDPRFAAECLAFSNVPEQPILDRLLGENPPGANPIWKSLVPRDGPMSWDFEDVRDHYLGALFGLDPARLRALDPERWLGLGRIATGEVMARTLAELRRVGSRCHGALIWHLRDLVPGAGCGVIDADGQPKAAYWFVARACAPIALFLVDEGLNGLRAHAINDTQRGLNANLCVEFLRAGRTRVERACVPLVVRARSAIEVSVDALLGRFVDPSHAYRFGPPSYDVAVASLLDRSNDVVLADAVYFPEGPPPNRRADLELSGQLQPHAMGFLLTLSTKAFAYAVHVDASGYEPSDNYFHLAPERQKQLLLRPSSSAKETVSARITASNGHTSLKLRSKKEARKSA